MRQNPPLPDRRLSELLDQVRQSTPEGRAEAVSRLFELLIPRLPGTMRTTAIDAVKWSHSFATNAWWKGVWQRLEVKQLADLTGVGAELATTRGVGRTKLFVLIQDLLDMARGPGIRVGEAMRSDAALETIRHSLERIEHGPPSPHAFHVQALFHTLLPMLPTEVRSWDLKSVPWTTEWLYTTSLWKVLGITVVGDLHAVAVSLCHARGIGKGKIVALARELIFLSPELHARLRKAVASHERGEEAGPRDPLGMRHRARPGTLVGAIDRLAERLSDRERDVLHRRIGWRYDRKPEKLRALADDHGVTQERIRQVEQQIRKRMLRLLRIRNVPLKLRETLRGRPAPVELAMIVACGPSELQGMMDVWRPLASLLETEGGPFLYEDQRLGGRVFVAAVPQVRRIGVDAGRPRHAEAEPHLSWPSSNPPSSRC